MWYQDYKKTSYKINTASDQSIGLVACWLFKSIGTNYYDMVSSAPLRQMIPTGNPSPFYDPLYQVSPRFGSGVYEAQNLFLIPPSSQYMSNDTTGETGEYRGSFAIFARFYYHPSYYNATGVLAGFSSGRNDLAHGLYLTEDSVIRFTVDNQLTYASGTIDLPEGWVDAWGIYDSGANPNTKVIIQGVEGNSVYSNATIIQPNPASPNLERSFVVAGDKGSGNTYRHAFSEVRIYNYAPPLGLAQKVYEPKDLNKLFNFEEDKLFNSVAETGVPMYIAAATKSSGNLPLFMKTIESGSKPLTLYTVGPMPGSGGMNLMIKNQGTTKNLPMSLWAAFTTSSPSYTAVPDGLEDDIIDAWSLDSNTNNLISARSKFVVSGTESYVDGISFSCFRFDGSTTMSLENSQTTLNLSGDKTISMFVSLGDVTTSQVIMGDWGPTIATSNWRIRTAPTTPTIFGPRCDIYVDISNGMTTISLNIATTYANQWVFICYTYDSTTHIHSAYYNMGGSTGATSSAPFSSNTGNSMFWVGCDATGGTVANGTKIDAIHVWDRILTGDEISFLGAGRILGEAWQYNMEFVDEVMFNTFPMWISAGPSSGDTRADMRMNLYLQNTDPTNPIPSSTMNMFVSSFYDIARNNLPGYIMGAGTSSNSNPIRSRGYIPGTGNMNMFIRNTETGYANNNTSLFITGPFPTTVTSGVPLYISGGYDTSTGEITFWTSGIATEQSGTDLFIAGY